MYWIELVCLLNCASLYNVRSFCFHNGISRLVLKKNKRNQLLLLLLLQSFIYVYLCMRACVRACVRARAYVFGCYWSGLLWLNRDKANVSDGDIFCGIPAEVMPDNTVTINQTYFHGDNRWRWCKYIAETQRLIWEFMTRQWQERVDCDEADSAALFPAEIYCLIRQTKYAS